MQPIITSQNMPFLTVMEGEGNVSCSLYNYHQRAGWENIKHGKSFTYKFTLTTKNTQSPQHSYITKLFHKMAAHPVKSK